MSGDSPALHPDHYRFWIEDQVRFADLDALGHCNNAAFAGYFESGRVSLLSAIGQAPGEHGRGFALVRQVIEYHRELGRGTRLRIGTRVVRLGRSSVTLANGVFAEDVCAASGEIVGVVIDLATRRPLEIPAKMREDLAAYS